MPRLSRPVALAARTLAVAAATAAASGGCVRPPRGQNPPAPLPPLPPLPLNGRVDQPAPAVRAYFAAARYGTDPFRARIIVADAGGGARVRITGEPADVALADSAQGAATRGFVMARFVNQDAAPFAPLGLRGRDTVWVYADSTAAGWRATLVRFDRDSVLRREFPIRREFHRAHIDRSRPAVTRFRDLRIVRLPEVPGRRFAPAAALQVDAAFAWVTNCAGSPGSCCSMYLSGS